MAYNNPSMMNSGHDMMKYHEMTHDEKKKHLWEELDAISCYLWEGEAWHEKTANECRKIGVRGWGRWHEAEGCYDAKERYCLDKLIRDKLNYAPHIDVDMIDKALNYSMSSMADFKGHHNIWIDREESFIKCLNKGIKLSSEFDMELYGKLCCLINEVQNEAMRVKMVMMRMDIGGWSGHDIGICSMILHEYFECKYDGGAIDFNLG